MAEKGTKRYFELVLVILLLLVSIFGAYAQVTQTQTAAGSTDNAGKTVSIGIGNWLKSFISWYTPKDFTPDEYGRYRYPKESYLQRTIVDLLIFFGIFLSLAMLGLGKYFNNAEGGRAAKALAVFLALALDFALVFGLHTLKFALPGGKESIIYDPAEQSVITMFFPFAKYFMYIAALIFVWALINNLKVFAETGWGKFWAFLVALLIVLIAFQGIDMLGRNIFAGWGTPSGGGGGLGPLPPVQLDDPQKYYDDALKYYNTAVSLKNKGDPLSLEQAKNNCGYAKSRISQGGALLYNQISQGKGDRSLSTKFIDLETKINELLDEISRLQNQGPLPPVTKKNTARWGGWCDLAHCGEENDPASAYASFYVTVRKSDGSAAPNERVTIKDINANELTSDDTNPNGIVKFKLDRKSAKYSFFVYYDGNMIKEESVGAKKGVNPPPPPPPPPEKKCDGYVSSMADIKSKVQACTDYCASCSKHADFKRVIAEECNIIIKSKKLKCG